MTQYNYEQTWQCHGYTLLSIDLGVSRAFEFKKNNNICSFVDKNWFCTYERNLGSMYYSKEEMKIAEDYGKKDFLEDSWFKKYIKGSRQAYSRAWKTYWKYRKEVMLPHDKKNLLAIIRKAGEEIIAVYGHFNISQPQCLVGVEKELEKELSATVPQEKIREVMLELTRPLASNMLDEEEIAWLRICLVKDSTKIEKIVQKHAEKYGVIGTADEGAVYDANYYRKLLDKTDKKQAVEKLKKKLQEHKLIALSKNKLIKEFKISKQAQKIARVLAITAHERFELRLRGWMPLDYWFISILAPKLEELIQLPPTLVRQMTLNELLDSIQTSKLNSEELKRRAEYFITGQHEGKGFFLTGKEGRKLALFLLHETPLTTNEIKGQVGFRGKIRGLAYVLHWNIKDLASEMEKMPEKAILVAGQTRPQLLAAIRKASAIVTDEGGITSHAAIISREMKIPSVIGTKIATKVIKTGDLIEVDAELGVVKKL